MTFLCESCHKADPDLIYCKSTDEYLCEECILLRAEQYFAAIKLRDEGETLE